MPTELKDDLDEQEELNIGDDGGDDNGSGMDNGSDGEPEDRGDEFIDPEADGSTSSDNPGDTDSKAAGDGDSAADQGGDRAESQTSGDSNDGEGSIPASRLGEVARTKSAATAIADGLVDGSIDPSVVRDFGGAAAVAKAIANRELSIEDLKTGIVPFKHEAQQQQSADPNSPAAWDLDTKYVEYQELVDAGETKEAAALLRQINKEERARERVEESRINEQRQTETFVQQLIADYPALANTKSPEHESVMVWANHLQATNRISRVEALKQAVERVGLVKVGANNGNNDSQYPNETPQQQTLRLRKEAAIKKAASAQNQQPPPMGLGATPHGSKQVDVDKLGEDEFARLSKEEKAALRGEKV